MNSPLLRLSVLALSFASTSLPALAQQRWGMPFEGQDWWLSHFISRGFTGSGPHGPKWWAGFTGPSHPWKNHFSGGGSGGSTVGVGTGGGGGDGGYVTVPEIDASTGLLAIAAVLAALAFAWEIRRRRSLA